jgi:hypothetical protein
VLTLLVCIAALLPACSNGHDENAVDATTTTSTGTEPLRGSVPVNVSNPERCDPIGDRCLLPFPNDFYTVRDEGTDTGRRLAVEQASMPANVDGQRIDPTEINRSDGFSPGSSLVALFPGLDAVASGLPPSTDIGASLEEDAPVVLLDTTTRMRHPHWAELDAGAENGAERLLFVRPAVNFVEGHRYVVALRNLRDASGTAVAPTPAFQAFRDRLDTKNPLVEKRRPAMERIFGELEQGGVRRADLVLAWSFTVASQRSLSERLLHMRDTAFEMLGDSAPDFTIDSVQELPTGLALRTVKGTFQVPRFLTGEGGPGSVLNNGDGHEADPLPEVNGSQTASFTCVVPRSVRGPDGATVPSRISLYGHSLLASASEVVGVAPLFASESNTTFCGTDEIGMSVEDLPNIASVLGDLSEFRSVADRLQQGILNMLFLGRLMKHPQGLAGVPAFQDAAGKPLLDLGHLVFLGLSQGGVLGGATTAVAQDWTRAVLGVAGMNFSVLLERSIGFDRFAPAFRPAYPDRIDQVLGMTLVQNLWDRGENNGYAHHMTSDPYAGTPEHEVLLFEAFADHLVPNVQTEVLARTIGASLRMPALAPGRSPDVEPFRGIPQIAELPFSGSALAVWDFGTAAAPPDNRPNRQGGNPHTLGATVPEVRRMVDAFLAVEGELIDVCAGQPCQTLPPGR